MALLNGSDRVGLDAYTESGEWQILRTMADSGDQFYESDPGVPFPRVRFTLYLRRKVRFAVGVFDLPVQAGRVSPNG